jgi:signal transduction histidine kinase
VESASGSVDARGLDGIMRRYEFRSVSVDPKAPMHVIAGYDDRVVFEPERRQLLTGLGLLAAVALLEMGLAYAGASRWVLRPVDRLGEVTAAVASGDLTSRVGRLGGSSEFDALGAQFDAMAEALQDRVRELRESQELLTAEQQRLRTILEELPIGVALVDERGAVLEINEANERIWQGGARPGAFEEYPGLYDLYDLASGEQIAPDAYPAARTLGTGESVQQEYGFRRFDGTRGFLRITSVPVTAGAVRWAVVVTEDVSHRFLRQRLSEALNRIETVVHSSLKASEILQRSLEAGAVALGVDSGTIEIREGDGWVVRFEHGLPAGSVGRRLSDEEAPNAAELARTREPLAVADMAGDPGRDRGFVKEYGERAVLGAPLVVRDEVAGALLFYEHEPREFADVEIDFARRLAASVSLALDNATLYDELEERVQRRTADLEAANRELEAFSYSVSHDLRAPLRSIDGFSRALEEDYAGRLDADAGDYLERIRAGANRMAELIDALLSLSRLTRAEMRFEPVDVSAMAEEVAAELREREPERNLDLTVAPGMRAIADPSLLRVLLTNLLSNAWKFTAGCDPALIEVGMVRAEGERVYYVRDNGVGFDMAYSNKLFTAFQRLHAQGEYPGIGIGLTIAARVVHRHGGRIWTEAEPGKGATFYFTLE